MMRSILSYFFLIVFLAVCQFEAKGQLQLGAKAAYSLSFAALWSDGLL